MSEPNGSFFISKPETAVDEVLNPDMLLKAAPEYYGPRFDAIADLRAQDDGSLHRGQGFRRVASLVNVPLFAAVRTVLDHEFMQDRKKFYAWLRRNRRYCTYDIRSHTVRPKGTITYVDGKAV